MTAETTQFNRGSEWRKWDLQVQTILDDGYVSIDSYWDELEKTHPDECAELVKKIGTEELIKKYDSKNYFNTDTSDTEKKKAENYSKLLLAYIDIFHNNAGAICITDHNYDNSFLVDSLVKEAEKTNIKVIPGVEINVQGVHILVLFSEKSYEKTTYSESIKIFLGKINVNNKKTNGVLSVSDKSYTDVLNEIHKIKAIAIYSHCNSSNGLFQERGKTDRTHLADQFNSQKLNVLQAKNKSSADTTSVYIDGKTELKSGYVFVLGCDSRSLKDILSADENGNFCWIKSEKTFEGLKQIIFDNKSRIFIGDRAPISPTNIIDHLLFKIPNGATVKVKSSESESEEKFCFEGLEKKLYLSPFFNSFIGGRGSGKSTILNFLGQYSTDPESSNDFWETIRPSFDTKDTKIFSFDGVEFFEFIGQSEVESFATNKEAFTSAVYERANILSDGTVGENGSILSDSLIKLGRFITLIGNLNSYLDEKEKTEKEKKVLESSIEITKTQEYSDIVTSITSKSEQKQELETWRITIDELRDSIFGLSEQYFSDTDDEEDDNSDGGSDGTSQEEEVEISKIALPYQEAYALVKTNIEAASTILDKEKFLELVNKENVLIEEIEGHEKELSILLEKAGLSPENILQVKGAPQRLVRINDNLIKTQKKIDDSQRELLKYESVLDSTKEAKDSFEKSIREAIDPLIKTLEEQAKENEGKDIKNIGLKYIFDSSEAWNNIASDLYEHFSGQYRDNERRDWVEKLIVGNKEIFTKDLKEINKLLLEQDKTLGYVKFLKDVFGDDLNYKIFKIIRDKHLNDVTRFKKIQVLYDGKDIGQASFGQKCTAVMVILLLFGNYPLIIDEPEAHLDSSLIANYLVPLIKKNKINRQLIFATHNANFVINGDSEKIFILKNETGLTDIIETTIEDLNNRDELLKLEGGRDAFIKRGEKLNI